MNMFSLSGKTAIITGGNSGIGLGMAKGLAEAGANVVIIGRNKIKNEDSIKILTQYNVKSISIEADVRNAAEISKALKIIKETFKEINILINNAGTTIRSQPENLTEKDWHFVMDSNLTSAFLFSKACYPEFKKAGGG